jgi:4-hydroxy-4-methyl-2-oxoglutarate aldolase
VVDFGGLVEVGGLKIKPGDLIHGDRHGVQTIPLEIVEKIPAIALEILERRQHIVGLCRSADFSLDELRKAIKEIAVKP